MFRSFFNTHVDVLLYILWLLATGIIFDFISGTSVNSDTEDDFSEFEDPDDHFTVDLTEPVSVDSNRRQLKDKNNEKNHSTESSDQPENRESDSDSPIPKPIPPSHLNDLGDESEVMSEDDDDSIALKDDEEFEGLSTDQSKSTGGQSSEKKTGKPNLIVMKVPHHLTRSWDNFHMEMLFAVALFIYTLNFIIGRAKNTQLANNWFEAHHSLLESNFAIVGDDGMAEPGTGKLLKESEHLYSLWCTGTVHCEAMLIELRLVKRQCLLFALANWLRPVPDNIVVKVIMDDSEMDGWVMAVGRKRRLQALQKDHQDLALYCPDKRGQRHPCLPESFTVLNEIPEAMSALLNTSVCKFMSDHEDSIDYLFFSDQYTGPKPVQEDTSSTAKPPVSQKALIFAFRLGDNNNNTTTTNNNNTTTTEMESNTQLFHFIFYMIDKVRRLRLTKEAKSKSERNRQRAHDSRLKSVHVQRQEAAQNRRGERMRAVKERIMTEDDPDKARKLEEKEQRKEKSRKYPKMKMLKMKGM